MNKVFVSSRIDELAAERAALTQALQSPEWDNFTFEWSGAFPESARDVYLKQVAEADVYLGIFFKAYSQATVDEYREARRLGKPILIYLKDCAEREPALTKFITEELYPAHKCQSFKTTDELVSHLPDIRRALDAEVQKHQRQAYLDALVTQTELLELAGIVDSGEQARPKLQEIFVALSAAEEVEERAERQPRDKREREHPIKITRRVTIEQALREHRNLMILGDPGAGKSTLLRYLTLVAVQGQDVSLRATEGSEAIPKSQAEIASSQKTLLAMTSGESRLPILIRLSSFARSGQSFIEYFGSYAKTQLHVSLGEKFFERALEDGQAIVCLDGLDEVSQPAQRFDVRNAITALANRYPRNRFIVTSRVAGYDSASLDKRAFAHHTIVPFGEKEIQTFVEKWYATRERDPEQAKTRAANLFDDLKANARLLKLAENPLTLTIIALVHQRAQGKLPDARVELYDRCAETLIEEWDKWKGLAPDDRARPYCQLRRRLLERAAYWMHIESQEQDVAQISKRALEMKVAEFLVEDKTLNLSEDTARIEAKQFVALATSRTGILVEREQGAVSFIHLTFQEYFSASDLYWRYRKTPDALWQAIQPHLYDSRWLEVILLLLGRLNDEGDTPSIIVGKILREHDKFDDVIHRDLFLAARCLADGSNVRESLRNEIVDALLSLGSERFPLYWSLQGDAIQMLGALSGDSHAADGLSVLVQNKYMRLWVRLDAARALGQLGRADDAVRLLLALTQDEQASEWKDPNFALTLGQLGRTDDAVGLLLALAQDEKADDDVRREAAQALGQLGRADDAVRLLLALAQDKKVYPDVRVNAARALKQLGWADGAVRMLSALAQDEVAVAWVGSDIAQALGEFGQTDNAVRLLLALAQDAKINDDVQGEAVQTLGQRRWADNTARLLLTLAQNGNVAEWKRDAAVLALGQIGQGDNAMIQGLLTLAQSESVDEGIRLDAARALGQLGHGDDAVRLLLGLAQDERVFRLIRGDATKALGKLGQKKPFVALELLKLAREGDDGVHDEAYDALKEVVGNLRYAELDNGQKRIKRTGRKGLQRTRAKANGRTRARRR